MMNFNAKLSESNQSFDAQFMETKQDFGAGFNNLTPINGLSAYELAVKNGFEGTESEWLESLHGKDGAPGKDGYTPQKGTDYYTEADKAEMVTAVLAALPVYNGEVVAV